MVWFFLLLLVVAVGALALSQNRSKQRAELAKASALRKPAKVAEEDVTRFGEELQELHIDTMTTELDAAMRQDYQRALDSYENAKTLLAEATVPEDISAVTKTLEDGRYAQACVLARQANEPLPQRRPPCFFNPAHGPALGERLVRLPGQHAGLRVAAVLEGLGDRRDVLRHGSLGEERLGVLVGVQRALVVLAHRRVELGGHRVDVQLLELLAEARHVLLGDLGRLAQGRLLRELGTLLRPVLRERKGAHGHGQQEQEEPHHVVTVATREKQQVCSSPSSVDRARAAMI